MYIYLMEMIVLIQQKIVYPLQAYQFLNYQVESAMELVQHVGGDMNYSIKNMLFIYWILFGILLISNGLFDVSSWKNNIELHLTSLRWWKSTTIIPGFIGLLIGVLINYRERISRILGSFLSSVFIIYTVYIILITSPENVISWFFLFQLFVVAFSIMTIFYFS